MKMSEAVSCFFTSICCWLLLVTKEPLEKTSCQFCCSTCKKRQKQGCFIGIVTSQILEMNTDNDKELLFFIQRFVHNLFWNYCASTRLRPSLRPYRPFRPIFFYLTILYWHTNFFTCRFQLTACRLPKFHRTHSTNALLCVSWQKNNVSIF